MFWLEPLFLDPTYMEVGEVYLVLDSLSLSRSLSLALALPTWKWKGHLLFVEEGFWSFQGPTIATSMIVLERERERESFFFVIK